MIALSSYVRCPRSGAAYSAVELSDDQRAVLLLDQRQLPTVETYLTVKTSIDMEAAIRGMVVRGAPAIGLAAAYALVVADARGEDWDSACERLSHARPTAVNLRWAIEAMRDARVHGRNLAEEAIALHEADVAACKTIGRYGASLLPSAATVLTYCNAGALATGGYGTALGVVRAAFASGKLREVFACETRPYWQGARLTAWELCRDGIPVTVMPDNAIGALMQRQRIDAVVVGADRIANNGDVANKVGTFSLAVLAQHHGVPFYVAAPESTRDLKCASGRDIEIEHRSAEELTTAFGVRLAPSEARAFYPAFDITPARLIAKIITERGMFDPTQLP